MDRVEEIATAIDRLQPGECRRVIEWLHAREQAHWDEQLDRDSAAGKLDFLRPKLRSGRFATGRRESEIGSGASGQKLSALAARAPSPVPPLQKAEGESGSASR